VAGPGRFCHQGQSAEVCARWIGVVRAKDPESTLHAFSQSAY
jgi:hypothetical protein